MSNHNCLFCGKPITAETILFVDTSFEQTYRDTRRFEFLMSCSSFYPLDNMDNFRGLYHRVTGENVRERDPNGFPTVLSVRLSEGLSPEELEREEETAEDSGRREQAPKPEGNDTERLLGTRACPHCHCQVPNNFGLQPVVNVTMLGGRAAGKTAYLISLLQQLQPQLTRNHLGSAILLPESRAFMEPQIEYFETHEGVPMPTPTERLFPLVFDYTYAYGTERRACYIALYDIAGEGIMGADNTGNVNYLLDHKGVQQAEIVLLMLDPNQVNQGAYGNAQYRKESPNSIRDAEAHDFFGEDIPTFLMAAVMQNHNLGILRNVEHILAVLTKIDLPMTFEPKQYAMGQVMMKYDIGNAHTGRVNMKVLQRIDYEVRVFFRDKLRTDVKEMIRSAFSHSNSKLKDISLFTVSTYTAVSQDTSTVEFKNQYDRTAPKHRIIEPFLKILALARVVPTEEVADTSSPVPQTQKKKRGLWK